MTILNHRNKMQKFTCVYFLSVTWFLSSVLDEFYEMTSLAILHERGIK